MPRLTSAQRNQQRAALLELIAAHPKGVGREALADEYEARFGERIEWRTLLRRLRDLAVAGQVRAVGKGRRRVYRSTFLRAGVGEEWGTALAADQDYVPLSAAGAEIRNACAAIDGFSHDCRDARERHPAGYRHGPAPAGGARGGRPPSSLGESAASVAAASRAS